MKDELGLTSVAGRKASTVSATRDAEIRDSVNTTSTGAREDVMARRVGIGAGATLVPSVSPHTAFTACHSHDPSGLRLRGEIYGRDRIQSLWNGWRDLVAHSVEDNVYYSPRYAGALLDHVERDASIGFATVWNGSQLVALLPFERSAVPVPLLWPSSRAWRTKYTFGCAPLIHREYVSPAADVLLDTLATIYAGEWMIPAVQVDGDACKALITALDRRQQPHLFLERFQRATLTKGASFDEHMAACVDAKRRRELARARRRLEERGKVELRSFDHGPSLYEAVQSFLRVEASGWKGQRGTALACDERTRQFALAAFTGSAHESICRADVLTLDGNPIAASIVVFAGATGFTVKCCYDEDYRSYSAGLLLEIEVIRSFLSENWADRLDAATAGAHVIDRLWTGRIEMADLLFSLAPRHAGARLSALRAAERVRRDLRRAIKRHVPSSIRLPGQ